MKIAIAGGTGFIGGYVVDYLLEQQDEVIIISRSCDRSKQQNNSLQCVTWEELENNTDALEGLDAIINLSGETINQRWTQRAKQRIRQSRIDVTQRVARIVAKLHNKPEVVLNGSGMSIYGTSLTDEYNESSPHRTNDFLASVVEDWEQAADQIQQVRIVKLRIGLALGMHGGALPKMAMPYRLGVGGRVGGGKQWLSWIHIHDMARLIRYCIEHQQITGPVNCTAPKPVINDEFGRALGKALKRPHYFPVPEWTMKLVFGEMSELLLKGQKVIPQKLLGHGFSFTYPELDEALQQLKTS